MSKKIKTVSIKKGESMGLPLTFSGKKGEGFTVLELLVSATILIVLMSFVLANFRAGQYSGELDVATKQIVDSMGTARTMTLGGQVIADPNSPGARVFPPGGYAVHFDTNQPTARRLVLYADGLNSEVEQNGIYNSGEEINGGIINFEHVYITQLCGLAQTPVSSIPCQSPWGSIGTDLDIAFSAPGQQTAEFNLPGAYEYVGGVFFHEKSNQFGYFYVSLLSGLVSGGVLHD